MCVCIMCGALSMCKQKSYGGLWPLSVCPTVQPSALELVSARASVINFANGASLSGIEYFV